MGRVSNKSAKTTLDQQRARKREQQRRRRQNFTEEQLKHKREKDMERYYRLKEENKIKGIAEKTPREQRKLRKYWKKSSKKYRERKKAIVNATSNTPPSSDIDQPNPISTQKERGRKKVRRDRAKSYRKIQNQDKEIKKLKAKVEKYKKRYQREKQKHKQNVSPSPRKKVKQLIGTEKVSPQVRKQLFLGYAFQKQVESQLKEAEGGIKKKQIARKVLGNKVLKKYRIQKYFKHLVPYRMSEKLKEQNFEYTRKKRQSVQHKEKRKLIAFFEEDTTSRMCPGKKDFVVRDKLKKQRRILLDSMTNLYKRFVGQTNTKISLATFCRSRPFWVTFPKKSDRDTCACIKHCNMCLMLEALRRSNVIQERNITEMLQKVVCSTKSENCMKGKCALCKDKRIQFTHENDFKIKYFAWKTIKEERTIRGKKKVITKTVKSKEIVAASKVEKIFIAKLTDFKEHVYHAYHQAKQLKDKIENLGKEELLFRIDFSENYVAKRHQEVQSAHFGASKKQIALNTGVMYFLGDTTVETKSFATASDNLDHQSHAVWAHLKPILIEAAKQHPETEAVHFFSDSPSSQYRNRNNIFLMKTLVPTFFKNVKCMTWNYTEAGHGKGPMDGVGGCLKREADQRVAYGEDIEDAASFVSTLQHSKVHLLAIDKEDVEEMKVKLVKEKGKIEAIKGIMQVRQVVFFDKKVYYKTLSCLKCPMCCDHYLLKKTTRSTQKSQPKNKGTLKRPLEKLAEKLMDEEWYPVNKKPVRRPWKSIYSDSDDDSIIAEDDDSIIAEEDDTSGVKSGESNNQIPGSSGSSSSSMASTKLLKPTSHIKIDTFVLVELGTDSKKTNKQTVHRYLAITQSNVVNDEVVVMFFKSASSENNLFYTNDKDISTIYLNQIVAIVPSPTIVMKGDRVYFQFKCKINVS